MAEEVPDWLRLQKKIFTRYVNQKFRSEKSETKVNDLIEDVKDGLVLIELMEIMSGKQFPDKKPKASKTRIQQIDNSVAALNFAKNVCGIKTDTSAENLVDGNEKLIMALIFQIIIKYMRLDEEDNDASTDVREALILWLKNRLQGYDKVTIDEKNLCKTFQDGLAFCALIHKMRPKLISFDGLTSEDKIGNLTLALDIAAKYCNVEKYLEPTDIGKLDELGMIVYLSDWYYGIALLSRQDAGARRIGKLITITQTHDRMKAEYNARSKTLVDWIDAKIASLDDHSFDNTLEGIKSKLSQFYEYKASEKGTKLTEHMDIEALYNDLSLRLQNNKRPVYQPPTGLSLPELATKLTDLENSENRRNEAMLKELARQNKLDKMSKRFHSDADKFAVWLGEKETYLNVKEQVNSIAQAQLHLNVLASYRREYESVRDARLSAMKTLAQEIVDDNFHKKNEISSKMSSLDSKFSSLEALEQSKNKTLEDDLAREKHKEKLRLDFASVATDFTQYCLDQIDICVNTYFGDTLEAVQAYLAILDKSDSDMNSSSDSKKASADDLWSQLQSYNVTENNYTTLTSDDLKATHGKLKDSIAARRAAYKVELDKQLANDALCKDFAGKAKSFMDSLATQKEATSDKSKELEKQLEVVDQHIAAKADADAKISELEALDAKIQAAEIINNKYTNTTSNDAKTSYEQFHVSLEKRKALLQNEIQAKLNKGITEEQRKEIESNFDYFDKDKSQLLEKRELRACLQSLGMDASPADVKSVLSTYSKSGDGKLTRDEFIDFMIKKLGDTDTKEEILEAFAIINQKEYAVVDLMYAVINEVTFKDEHLDYLKKEMSPEADGLNYKKWVDEVFAR